MRKLFVTCFMIVCVGITACVDLPACGRDANYNDALLLFSGNANPLLGESIAEYLTIPSGKIKVSRFNDGEIDIRIYDNVRNKNVFVVQSTCSSSTGSVNDNLMELFLIIRTLRRSSAGSITAVIPYYGYARQDRKMESRVPISASDFALLIESAGVDRVIAIDLHCGQIQGFFHDIPVDNLFTTPIFVPHIAQHNLVNPVVISPDAGGVKRAKRFKNSLENYGVDSSFAIIVNQRVKAGYVDKMNLVGDVDGCDCIIVDDICDTAGTLVRAARELKEFGARRVFACITHPVFSGPALERIANSDLTEIVVTDTIPLPEELPANIKQLTVAPLLAQAISIMHYGGSISDLFTE